jgi:hypothetical protein
LSYCSLLEFVGFEYLSRDPMTDFIELIATSPELLSSSVWARLQLRLIEGSRSGFSGRIGVSVFRVQSESPSDGIISFLTKTCGWNVCDLGVVSVTSSGVSSGYEAKNAVDFESSRYLQTADAPNSWLCYDFKEMAVKVTDYSIRTRPDYDGYHPRTWTVEGSVDGRAWIELDRQDERFELSGVNKWASFCTSVRARVRLIRLRQHGKDSNGRDFLTVGAFELFGTLYGTKA